MPRSTAREPDSMKWLGHFDVKCFDKDGNLLWEDLGVPNALFDEGEQLVCQVFFQAAALANTDFFIGLLTTGVSSPQTDETKTLATIGTTGVAVNELASGLGYTRKTVERSATGWPTITLNSGDYQAVSKTLTWTAAGGNWATAIRWMFLTDQGTAQNTTGKLIALAQLSADRTINNGDSLQLTYTVKLQ